MNQSLIFLQEKAIMFDKIAYLDFSNAKAELETRYITVHLMDHTTLTVRESQSIALLVQNFVPEPIRQKYQNIISLERKIPS